MKLLHLSDLHLGKRLCEYSLLEDQEYILVKILNIIDEEKPDAVLIAGDVYDKSVPSAEAVSLFDSFLVKLSLRGAKVFVISGNHDSAERISFGRKLMDKSGVYLSEVYNGKTEPVVLCDEYGEVNFYLLPFIKPATAKRFFDEESCATYSDTLDTVIESMNADFEKRNVILSHQFVTGAKRSDSEEVSVGGLDNVNVSVYEGFDYVALGHIHGPQNIGKESIRYCGTPLKYSLSEKDHEKSVTVIELFEKGNIKIKTVPLVPKREMREIKGKFDDIMLKNNYEGTNTDDYVHIVLTDEEDVFDALRKLSNIYPNILSLDYCNTRTKTESVIGTALEMEKKSEAQLFGEFFEKQNGLGLSDRQKEYTEKLFETVKEELS